MVLHANAIAQNRATRVGTCRIDRDDPDLLVLFAISLGQLVYQRALSCSRGSGQADRERSPSVRKQLFQQFSPSWSMVFDNRNSTGKSAGIARTKDVNRIFGVVAQAIKCKTRWARPLFNHLLVEDECVLPTARISSGL